MDWTTYLLPIVGFLTGFLITFIGGGGGAVYIPLLVLLFGLHFKDAVPISLAAMIFASLAGSVGHYRQGNIHIRGGLLASIASILGTGFGTYISTIAPETILQRAFGLLLLAMIYPMWLEIRGRKEKLDREELEKEIHILEHPFDHGRFIASMIFLTGFASGVSAGLFGVSGVVTLIVGFYLIGVKAKVIVGTSIFILFFKALSGFLWHIAFSDINWTIVILLSLGTAIGGVIGPIVLERMHHEKAENMLEWVFIGIIAVLAIIFLTR